MFGRGASPVEAQISSLEGEKAKIHIELAALHHLREMAQHDEVAAMAQLDIARATQVNIDAKMEKQLEAIISIQHEIADLIPKPRGA